MEITNRHREISPQQWCAKTMHQGKSPRVHQQFEKMQHVSCNWEILINFGLSYEKPLLFSVILAGFAYEFQISYGFPMIVPCLGCFYWTLPTPRKPFWIFDGTTWALCCARVCQLHPKAVPCMEFHFARYGCSYVRWIVILLSIF